MSPDAFVEIGRQSLAGSNSESGAAYAWVVVRATRPRRMGSRNTRLMCYKSPWGRGREKRRPSTLAGGLSDGLYIKPGRNYPRAPASGAIRNSRL
jgi:hypothetical protein